MTTVFKKIIDGEVEADIVYQDEKCLAFKDLNPQAPVHVLLIPKKEIASLDELEAGDAELMGHLMLKVPEVAAKMGLADDGYRVVCNNGRKAGQSVFHLHIHILGGRAMSWPPG